MAEIQNTAVIGNFSVRPTEEAEGQLERLKRYDANVGYAGHNRLHQFPASFYQIDMYVVTTANNGTKRSGGFKAPWPFTIWAADVACESCAATTGTVDIKVDDESVLDAPEDVKTGTTAPVRVAPEEDAQDVAYDSELYIEQTAGSAADMIGGQAHLYVQRL